MGMYTEIIFGAVLKRDTPQEVIDAIHNLIADSEPFVASEKGMPNHPFFKTERRWLLCGGGSYYFPGVVAPQFIKDDIDKQWRLHFRTNIKNYDGAIGKFLDWIKPYIDQGSGQRNFYAVVTYEEDSEPTIYYKDA